MRAPDDVVEVDIRPHPSEGPSLPDRRAVDAFVSRFFVCHSCGDAGREARDTDPGPTVVRFRFGAGRLLLSSCAACDRGGAARRRAADELARLVDRDAIAWVDPGRLLVHLCSRAGCARPWHHLGGPLPFASLGDPHPSMPHRRWHPCPWCVAEDLDAAGAEHDARRDTLVQLGLWAAEFGGR